MAGYIIDIFENQSDWQDTTTTRHTPVVQMRFVRARHHRSLYWMRRDLTWRLYEPSEIDKSPRSALEVECTDAHCCFFS